MLRGTLRLLSLKAGAHLDLCSALWGPSILFSAEASGRKTLPHYPFQSIQDEHLTAVVVPVGVAVVRGEGGTRGPRAPVLPWDPIQLDFSGKSPAAP